MTMPVGQLLDPSKAGREPVSTGNRRMNRRDTSEYGDHRKQCKLHASAAISVRPAWYAFAQPEAVTIGGMKSSKHGTTRPS